MALVKTESQGQFGSYAGLADILKKLDALGIETYNDTVYDGNEQARGVVTYYRKKGDTKWSEPLAWVKVEVGAPNNRNSAMQQWGSAYTYARRFSLLMALGLAPSDEDDGEAVGEQVEYVTQKQGKRIHDAMKSLGVEDSVKEVNKLIQTPISDSRKLLASDAEKVIAILEDRVREEAHAASQES
jgi:hypothetical protein